MSWMVKMSLAWILAVSVSIGACVHHKGGGERRDGTDPGPESFPMVSQADQLVRVYSKAMLDAIDKAGKTTGAQAQTVTALGSDGRRYQVTLDMQPVRYSLSVPEDREIAAKQGKVKAKLYKSFRQLPASSTFLPVVALALKAKQFDDGLVAAVELASERGLGKLPGKRKLLTDMLDAFSKGGAQEAAAIVAAALQVGGESSRVPAGLSALVRGVLGRRTMVQKTPLGIYTWSPELTKIYLRDKVLQLPFETKQAGASKAVQAMSGHEQIVASYEKFLHLAERLTNTLQFHDLRPALRDKTGKARPGQGPIALFPPSRSPETDIFLALFGKREVPKNFDLSKEIVQRIRSGKLSLKPGHNSGWYLWQLYALEAILQVEQLPEGKKLKLDRGYVRMLEGLFKALYGLTRETHVKQLYSPMAGAGAPMRHQKVSLSIPMILDVEPLATYYERRAASYRFVRQVLQEAFGADALGKMHRRTASGPVNLSLDAELSLMESLFAGAAGRVTRQLGLAGQPGSVSHHEAVLMAWWKHLGEDPDLGKDVRMMVPVFLNQSGTRVKVWAVLGLAHRPLDVYYGQRPRVTAVLDDKGHAVPIDKFTVSFERATYQLPYLVSAELWTTKLLDRPSFRRICDRYRTFGEIVEHLPR